MDATPLHEQLEWLKAEHRRLDEAIAAMLAEPNISAQIDLARLKKRKLLLKDQIQMMIDRSIPDIIA